MAELKDKIAALEPHVLSNPAAMLTLARMLKDDGQEKRALVLCRSALSLAPHDALLAARAKRLIGGMVPGWHFTIVNDEARNAAYDAALRRAVMPESRVLEIGTGTGLLAMMAARAGPAEVIACEMTPAIAEKAVEIVALNGYADRVRVVEKHSDDLDVEADMGGRADILVSEIVSNNLLGERVLPAHERAVRDLLKPGARVIPSCGTVRVALAHDSHTGPDLTNVAGFDLSPFNALARPVRQIGVGHERLSLRSEPADLFVFDLAGAQFCAPSQTLVVCRSTGGRVNGIAQWIALELDAVTHYENRPALGATSCWAALFYPFAQAWDTVPGEEFRVCGAHDRESLMIWGEARRSSQSVPSPWGY
ncbi:MAG TPA: 50S ribosomal protein L11 methyltransferase [Stellaceae bacterium]|jgi:type II protein arginine methyltransferase